MSLEEKVKQLELENARLKRRVIRLTREYNHLHSIASSLNNQVKEYRTLTTNICDKLNKQLDITETFVLSNAKKVKEEI
jgi:NAD-dependent SIR2 family protein deacetylase